MHGGGRRSGGAEIPGPACREGRTRASAPSSPLSPGQLQAACPGWVCVMAELQVSVFVPWPLSMLQSEGSGLLLLRSLLPPHPRPLALDVDSTCWANTSL